MASSSTTFRLWFFIFFDFCDLLPRSPPPTDLYLFLLFFFLSFFLLFILLYLFCSTHHEGEPRSSIFSFFFNILVMNSKVSPLSPPHHPPLPSSSVKIRLGSRRWIMDSPPKIPLISIYSVLSISFHLIPLIISPFIFLRGWYLGNLWCFQWTGKGHISGFGKCCLRKLRMCFVVCERWPETSLEPHRIRMSQREKQPSRGVQSQWG